MYARVSSRSGLNCLLKKYIVYFKFDFFDSQIQGTEGCPEGGERQTQTMQTCNWCREISPWEFTPCSATCGGFRKRFRPCKNTGNVFYPLQETRNKFLLFKKIFHYFSKNRLLQVTAILTKTIVISRPAESRRKLMKRSTLVIHYGQNAMMVLRGDLRLNQLTQTLDSLTLTAAKKERITSFLKMETGTSDMVKSAHFIAKKVSGMII